MSENIIGKKEEIDHPKKKFIVYSSHPNAENINPNEISGGAVLGTISSDDDAVQTRIWGSPRGSSNFIVWEVNVDKPHYLASWDNRRILIYVQTISRFCKKLDKIAYIFPMGIRENSEDIFTYGGKKVENWLLAVKENWEHYLSPQNNTKREMGFERWR